MQPRAVDVDRLRALGAFFVDRPDRILAVAAQFQKEGRVIQSRVVGPSMGSCLPDGAPILIAPRQREDCEAGTIIAFVGNRKVIVHRVVFCGRRGRARGILVTRGDASRLPDPPIEIGSVLGEVIAVQSEAGWAAPAAGARRPAHDRFVARSLELCIVALCRISPRFARWLVTTVYGSRHVFVPLYRWWLGARGPTPRSLN
jgi:hypothetical protein